MSFGTFQVLNPGDQCYRRNRCVLPDSILRPSASNALEQGEWLNPNVSDSHSFERYGAADSGPTVSYPVAARRGSTDVQSLGKTELYMSWVEAMTTTYDSTSLAQVAPGAPLKVSQIDIDGENFSILALADTSGDHVVAEILEPPTTPASYTEMRIRNVRYDLP